MSIIAIVGATGLVGSSIAEAALTQGHTCLVISRARTPRNRQMLERLEKTGAQIRCAPPNDVRRMKDILAGCDVLICAMGEAGIYGQVEYRLLEAAQAAGVKRFVPNEFGLDTLCIPEGTGKLFDEKKRFRDALNRSGMPFTVVFNGGIFDYFLPNLSEYSAITTFGDDLDVPYYTHARQDLSAITIQAALDARCENRCIHLKHNLVTQQQVLELLDKNFPDHQFPRAHMPQREILDGTHEVKAAIWIYGHAGKVAPQSVDAGHLFPDYPFLSADEALSDPRFVLGSEAPA